MKRALDTHSFKIILVLALAVVMSLALVGCGSGGQKGKNLVGTWTATSISQGDTSYNMEELAEYGVSLSIAIKDDGTYVYSMSGEADETGNWTGKDDNNGTIKLEGEELSMNYDGTNLTLKDAADGKMTFKKA